MSFLCGGKKKPVKKPADAQNFQAIPKEPINQQEPEEPAKIEIQPEEQPPQQQEPPHQINHQEQNQPTQTNPAPFAGEIDNEEEEQLALFEQSKARVILPNADQSFMRNQLPTVYQTTKKEDLDGPYVQNLFQVKQGTGSPPINNAKPIFSLIDGILFANVADITQKVFFAKGIDNCCTYRLYLHNTKFMLKNYAFCSEEFYVKLLNLYRNKSHLSHPNIRKIQGFLGESVDRCYNFGLVSEYSRHNIYTFAAQNNISLADRFDVARSIVKGVVFLHSHEIIIGNLKPSNILINEELQVTITDWELSYDVEQMMDRKKIDLMPVYTAPEIYINKDQEYTSAADVWSMGYIFFVLFFQIDLAVDNHRLGLQGKAQCVYFNNYNVYTKDGINFDSNKITLPPYMEGCSQAYILEMIKLIQTMTTNDPSTRLKASQIISQLEKVQNQSVDKTTNP